jgi:hypothetical protein
VKILLLEIPLLLLAAWIFLFDRRMASRGRRSPFNENILNSPGHSARKAQLERIGDFVFYVFGVAAAPFIFAAAKTESMLINWLFGVTGLLAVSFCFYKAVKLYKLLTRLNLGVDAELAAGQELNLLMRDGAWVYHDIQYTYGNIDHVVIGTGGVFAVETKGISKPTDQDRSGSENATLTVTDGTLVLPHARTKKPIEQATRHAKWLRQEIEKRVGVSVPVRAVVAIPGWMINGGFDGDCWVINPKRGNALRASVSRNQIEPEVVSRIAAWAEDLARTVAPKSKQLDPKSAFGP